MKSLVQKKPVSVPRSESGTLQECQLLDHHARGPMNASPLLSYQEMSTFWAKPTLKTALV